MAWQLTIDWLRINSGRSAEENLGIPEPVNRRAFISIWWLWRFIWNHWLWDNNNWKVHGLWSVKTHFISTTSSTLLPTTENREQNKKCWGTCTAAVQSVRVASRRRLDYYSQVAMEKSDNLWSFLRLNELKVVGPPPPRLIPGQTKWLRWLKRIEKHIWKANREISFMPNQT